MQWRVMVELAGATGASQVLEVHVGGSTAPGCSAATLGLSLAEAKAVMAGLQRHLVQAQAEEHCQLRRRCPRCAGQRPLKDRRSRQLRSLFGTVEVHAPRFEPCRCSVTLRTVLSSPVAEIMPDRCTPEYERVLAEFGALLPYRRARALLGNFFPVADLPTIDTIQRRTLQVGARLESEAAAAPAPVWPAPAGGSDRRRRGGGNRVERRQRFADETESRPDLAMPQTPAGSLDRMGQVDAHSAVAGRRVWPAQVLPSRI